MAIKRLQIKLQRGCPRLQRFRRGSVGKWRCPNQWSPPLNEHSRYTYIRRKWHCSSHVSNVALVYETGCPFSRKIQGQAENQLGKGEYDRNLLSKMAPKIVVSFFLRSLWETSGTTSMVSCRSPPPDTSPKSSVTSNLLLAWVKIYHCQFSVPNLAGRWESQGTIPIPSTLTGEYVLMHTV